MRYWPDCGPAKRPGVETKHARMSDASAPRTSWTERSLPSAWPDQPNPRAARATSFRHGRERSRGSRSDAKRFCQRALARRAELAAWRRRMQGRLIRLHQPERAAGVHDTTGQRATDRAVVAATRSRLHAGAVPMPTGEPMPARMAGRRPAPGRRAGSANAADARIRARGKRATRGSPASASVAALPVASAASGDAVSRCALPTP